MSSHPLDLLVLGSADAIAAAAAANGWTVTQAETAANAALCDAVLLSAAGNGGHILAVASENAVAGAVLSTTNPDETATYVIERDVIETISDEGLNGRYHPPFSA